MLMNKLETRTRMSRKRREAYFGTKRIIIEDAYSCVK